MTLAAARLGSWQHRPVAPVRRPAHRPSGRGYCSSYDEFAACSTPLRRRLSGLRIGCRLGCPTTASRSAPHVSQAQAVLLRRGNIDLGFERGFLDRRLDVQLVNAVDSRDGVLNIIGRRRQDVVPIARRTLTTSLSSGCATMSSLSLAKITFARCMRGRDNRRHLFRSHGSSCRNRRRSMLTNSDEFTSTT